MKKLLVAIFVISLFASGCKSNSYDSASSGLDAQLSSVPASAKSGPDQPQKGFDQEVDEAVNL